MKNNIKKIATLTCLIFVLLIPYFAFAGNTPLNNLKNVGVKGGYAEANEYTFSVILGSVVSIFLGFLGIIFLILTIYAGYNWMTAGGNEEKVTKAQDTLKRAIIGLIITVSAYAIWTYILLALL